MFTYPYETTPCADYALGNIIKGVKLALINDGLRTAQLLSGRSDASVMTVTPLCPDIPPFSHPLEIEHHGNKFVVIDVRGFTRLTREREVIVTARNEYDLTYLRGFLSRYWSEHMPGDLLALGPLPMTVYCRWLSESIVRRMGLDPAAQMIVTVIAGFFYLSLFRAESNLDERDLIKFAKQISASTFVPVDKCLEIADQLTPMGNIGDFVDNVIKVVNSTRLEKFSVGLLYTIIMNSWFGIANHQEIVAVSLEHPPTFLAMVYTALKDRSYRNSGLARMVLASDKGDLGKQFTYNLASLTNV